MTTSDPPVSSGTEPPEVSVVMPCLDEAETLPTCLAAIARAFAEHGIRGEVVVADNGSRDGSAEVARAAGARVVAVAERGYGAALHGGIAAARGRFVVMGDADASYDFGELPRFLERLREGAELVQGCRLPAGGGTVRPGAMPWLHRWLGNPAFSALARRWYRAPVHDVYCGLRGFTRELWARLDLRCTGMEYATEMIVKASLAGARIAEVPITLHPDGRTAHRPHLRTVRDGWRTLRFLLLYSPRRLFLAPGALLVALGIAGYAIAMPGLAIQGVRFDVHTLLFASLAILVGVQAIAFAVVAKTFAVTEGLLPPDAAFAGLLDRLRLERGLVLAALALVVGLLLLVTAVLDWARAGFGDLDYARTMRVVIPGATLAALGIQILFASFLVALLGLRRR